MSAAGPSKRHKGEGPPPPEGYHGAYPPGGRYPPYGTPSGPPMGPQSGYNMWQPGQYGSHPPHPSHSSHGYGPPGPNPMYGRGRPPMTPDRARYGASYGARGPPPPPMPGPPRRGAKPPGPVPRPGVKTADTGSGPDGPPSAGYQGGPGWGGHPQQGQWSQHQWAGGPTPYQGAGPPPMHRPPNYGPAATPTSYASSPPRPPSARPRGSPTMVNTFPDASQPSNICQTVDTSDLDMFNEDGASVGGSSSAKDKGRGSYKCGRCGVPKKGHICPYQPKLTRRPGEPLPELRSAAIQVEMDEFMTLRRLNLRIQGFPESYAAEPFMEEDMVVGEPHPPHTVPSTAPGGPPASQDAIMSPKGSSPIEDPMAAAV